MASITGSTKDFLELYATRFGVDVSDSSATKRWLEWFNRRFLRVFFVFITEVNKHTGATSDLFARARKLSREKMGIVGTEVINAKNIGWFGKPIWAIVSSPWGDYELLNDSKGPYNICLDLMTGTSKDDSAADYAIKSKSTTTTSTDTKTKTANADTSGSSGGKSTGSNKTAAETPKDVGAFKSDVVRTAAGGGKAASKPSGAPALDMTPSTYGKFSGMSEGSRVLAKQPIGDYILPTSGSISSGFKIRKHPTLGVTRRHAGIDIAAPKGSEVYAIGNGVVAVALTGKNGGMGNCIFINHPDGYQSRYLHLNSIHSTVKVGAKVSKGQLIGTVGMTGGVSTGNHLHLAIVKGTGTGKNVEFIDPAKFFDEQAKKGSVEGADMDGGDVPATGSAGLASTAPTAGTATTSSPTAPKQTVSSSSPNTTEDIIKPKVEKGSSNPNSPTASGGPDLNDMIESSAHMQDKLTRIGDENKILAANMRQAVQHLSSIDTNINELVGLMRDMGGGNSSQANKPPPRTAKANVVSFKK
jgi:murein DD-endopeptidase MepM/ murein hydrolase activator NlpD